MKLLFKNGTIFDGTGKKRYVGDVRVSDVHIVEVGKNLHRMKNEDVIDATGLYICPGFVDINSMSDNYGSLFSHREQTSLVRQGITTILIGNDGFSFAPLLCSPKIVLEDKVSRGVDWIGFGEYLNKIGARKYGVNVASLVGHTTVHRGITKGDNRRLKKDEVDEFIHFYRGKY